MELGERLRMVRDSVSEHPRRVIASSMGLFWGAAAMVVMLAWGPGFRDYMHDELRRYGRPMVFVIPGITSSGYPGYRAGRHVEISRDDARAAEVSNAARVEAILAEHLSWDGERVLARAGGRVRRLDLSGVDERYAALRGFSFAHGSFFEREDVERRRAVAVLGWEAAEELYGSAAAAVGRSLRIDGHPFEVVGVTARKGRQYFNTNRPDNRLLMVPITTAESRLGFSEERVERLNVIPRAGVPAAEAFRAALATLAQRGGFHPDDTDAVMHFDLGATLALVDLVHVGFLAFVGLAGTVTLLVAGVGVANFHLATLAQRAVEIGVCKALGASNRTLVAQTVLESLLVSGSAAGLGVALGLASCLALDALAPAGVFPTPVISLPTIAITAAALLGVGTIAALVPALRVRRMEISAALRAAA